MNLDYTPNDIAFLSQVRSDILGHLAFYKPGAEWLLHRYNSRFLHEEGVSRWQQQQSTMRDYAEKLIAPDWEPDEIDRAERGFSAHYNVEPPIIQRWSPAACACYAVQHLLGSEGTTHNDTRAKAILILAVLLWDEEAEKRDALFNVFGEWGEDLDGNAITIGRFAATAYLHKDRLGRPHLRSWMDLVWASWTALHRGTHATCNSRRVKPKPKSRRAKLKLDRRKREVWYGEKRLKINGNAQFDVLATLWAAKGNIVPYLDLCKAIDEKRFSSEVQSTKKAPPELREIVTFIHQALRANDIPIRIKAIRGLGYRLLNADE